MTARHRTLARLGTAAVVLALAGCTTAVTGTGRPAGSGARPSAGASGSGSPSATGTPTNGTGSDVPSGAPAPPAEGNYEDQTPWRRSWLYAFDASTDTDAATANGSTLVDGVTVTLAASYGLSGNRVGRGTVGAYGFTAEFAAVENTFDVRAPAAFWTALGVAADVAAQVDNRWAAVDDDTLLPVGAVHSFSRLLITFEPEQSDTVETGTEDGGATYVVTNATDGYTTLIGHDSGLITGVRCSNGTLQFAYDTAAPEATLPDPAEVVTVPGLA